MVERAVPRRFSGKPIAIGLAVFLVVGTALTIYFASRNMYARAAAFEAADRAAAGQTAP
jgi:hypothetical protein